MTAAEARQKASEINSDHATKQYNEIIKSIESCANNGKTETFVYSSILPEVKMQLIKLGYTIKEYDGRNETTNTISW